MKIKYKKKINNDLAVVVSQIPVRAVHDTTEIFKGEMEEK